MTRGRHSKSDSTRQHQILSPAPAPPQPPSCCIILPSRFFSFLTFSFSLCYSAKGDTLYPLHRCVFADCAPPSLLPFPSPFLSLALPLPPPPHPTPVPFQPIPTTTINSVSHRASVEPALRAHRRRRRCAASPPLAVINTAPADTCVCVCICFCSQSPTSPCRGCADAPSPPLHLRPPPAAPSFLAFRLFRRVSARLAFFTAVYVRVRACVRSPCLRGSTRQLRSSFSLCEPPSHPSPGPLRFCVFFVVVVVLLCSCALVWTSFVFDSSSARALASPSAPPRARSLHLAFSLKHPPSICIHLHPGFSFLPSRWTRCATPCESGR